MQNLSDGSCWHTLPEKYIPLAHDSPADIKLDGSQISIIYVMFLAWGKAIPMMRSGNFTGTKTSKTLNPSFYQVTTMTLCLIFSRTITQMLAKVTLTDSLEVLL